VTGLSFVGGGHVEFLMAPVIDESCAVLDIVETEKYISRSADGKDTDRMTFLPK
jgi:hypothetical protein